MRLAFALSLVLSTPAAAQNLLLFDSSTFGKTVLSQTQSAVSGIQLEAQIGDYNNEFISNYGNKSVFALTGRAVGRLDILTNVGHAPCTAFLLEGNRLITNHHCVPGILDNPEMVRGGATSILAVQFKAGYLRDGIEEGVKSFYVNPVPIETSKDLDYTLLEVTGDPNSEFGALALSDALPNDRDPFWVIGHPLGEAQRISREKCQADSPALASGRVRHTCDTLPGNSGSPVIDAGLQQVVALHHAGSRAGAVNFAIPMRDIIAFSNVLSASLAKGSDNTQLLDERAKLEAELARLKADRDRLAALAIEGQQPIPAPSLTIDPDDDERVKACDALAGDPRHPDLLPGVGISRVGDIKPADAIRACNIALKKFPDHPRITYNLARAYTSNKQFNLRAGTFKKAADLGDPVALTALADCHFSGCLELPDSSYKTGVELYLEAANTYNYSYAMLAIAGFYKQGAGVKKDYQTALDWYEKSALAGNPIAAQKLGVIYEDAVGVSRDYAQAVKWFQLGSDRGDALSMAWLSRLIDKGRGTNPDPAKAASLAVGSLQAGQDLVLEFTFSRPTSKEIQKILKAKGHYTGPIDGSIGKGTINALRKLIP